MTGATSTQRQLHLVEIFKKVCVCVCKNFLLKLSRDDTLQKALNQSINRDTTDLLCRVVTLGWFVEIGVQLWEDSLPSWRGSHDGESSARY